MFQLRSLTKISGSSHSIIDIFTLTKDPVCGFRMMTFHCYGAWPAICDVTFGIVGIFGGSLLNLNSYSFPKGLCCSFVLNFIGIEKLP